MSEQRPDNSILVKRLLLTVAGMFAFGFALVPLYDVFCEVTGFNGRTSNEAAVYQQVEVDESRTVTVQFLTRNAKGIPWKFEPSIKQVKIHPGEVKVVNFFSRKPDFLKHDRSGYSICSACGSLSLPEQSRMLLL